MEAWRRGFNGQAPGIVAALRTARRHGWWGYLKGCYYTLRYVDSHTIFPAIVIDGRVKLRISKATTGRIDINGRLTVSGWMGGESATRVCVGRKGRLTVRSNFWIGHDVLLVASDNATLELGGALNAALSGITCRAIVFATTSVKIGSDCIVSWDTTITDSDHHAVGGASEHLPVELGDGVWVCMGARILKGAKIGPGSVVAAAALVLRGEYPSGSVLGGVPARVLPIPYTGSAPP